MISSNRIMHLLINLNRDEQDDLIAEIIDKAIRDNVTIDDEEELTIEYWVEKVRGRAKRAPSLYRYRYYSYIDIIVIWYILNKDT